jgi:hypothetical protein
MSNENNEIIKLSEIITKKYFNINFNEEQVANLMKDYYKNWFVCINNNKWYYYDNNKPKWIKDIRGRKLSSKISNEVFKAYNSVYSESHIFSKSFNDLKNAKIKRKIMNECKELFIDNDTGPYKGKFEKNLKFCDEYLVYNYLDFNDLEELYWLMDILPPFYNKKKFVKENNKFKFIIDKFYHSSNLGKYIINCIYTDLNYNKKKLEEIEPTKYIINLIKKIGKKIIYKEIENKIIKLKNKAEVFKKRTCLYDNIENYIKSMDMDWKIKSSAEKIMNSINLLKTEFFTKLNKLFICRILKYKTNFKPTNSLEYTSNCFVFEYNFEDNDVYKEILKLFQQLGYENNSQLKKIEIEIKNYYDLEDNLIKKFELNEYELYCIEKTAEEMLYAESAADLILMDELDD